MSKNYYLTKCAGCGASFRGKYEDKKVLCSAGKIFCQDCRNKGNYRCDACQLVIPIKDLGPCSLIDNKLLIFREGIILCSVCYNKKKYPCETCEREIPIREQILKIEIIHLPPDNSFRGMTTTDKKTADEWRQKGKSVYKDGEYYEYFEILSDDTKPDSKIIVEFECEDCHQIR